MATPVITPFMHLGTEKGDIELREEDLPKITDAELKKWRISREDLQRCFSEAMEMMRDATQEDWAKFRPVADGTWEVVGPVGYTQHTHPLLHGPSSGKA